MDNNNYLRVVPPKWLAFDCETGGTDPRDTSLLSVYFAVYDENFFKNAELELYLRPDDGVYRLTGEAMGVNKIDIVAHDKVAVDMSEGERRLRQFLGIWSDSGRNRLTPLGHNINFDKDYVIAQLMEKREFERYTSYRVRDTMQIAGYLQEKGKIAPGRIGLSDLLRMFNIPIAQSDRHTAKGDTEATVALYQELLKL